MLRIRDFYSTDRMAAIESVAPGWGDMAAHADRATLNHITQALIALQRLPEYRQASGHLQAMMEWTVLYHDLGKQVIAGQRDALHAFRSAVMAARRLPKVGFAVNEAYAAGLDAWTRRVLGASVPAPDGKGLIQDNRVLPEILSGIDNLFGTDAAAAAGSHDAGGHDAWQLFDPASKAKFRASTLAVFCRPASAACRNLISGPQSRCRGIR